MKTPSPQEAAKTDWAERWARKFFEKAAPNSPVSPVAIQILTDGFFEADKNGYERGRKETVEDISDVIGEHEAESDLKVMFAVIRFLDEARLAPSGSVSEGKNV